MAKFELGSVLAEALGNVSKSGTEQIEYLPLENLVCDERNFYSMEGVDALAANIELVGLQQPLRVIAGEPPYYVIVSGHRRRAALRILAEENPERWKTVPCIVETASGSPELQELRLIMANADTRKMSSADLAKQAERVTELLYALKEQGIEFPGRMRDHVAEACKVSKTKLAELKVIREKLNPEIRTYWESGELNHASAYLIAKADELTQRQLCTYVGADRLPGAGAWWIESKIRTLEKMTQRVCPATGDLCAHRDVMIGKRFMNTSCYCDCEYHCCADCPKLDRCKSVCIYQAEAQKKLKAERAEREQAEKDRNAAREKEQKARREHEIREGNSVWARFDRAARAARVKPRELIALLTAQKPEGVEDDEIAEYQQRVEGRYREIDDNTDRWLFESPLYSMEDAEDLAGAAELLNCSADYLLGLTDDLTPVGGEKWISVEEQYPTEGQYVWAVDNWTVPMPSVYFRAAFMEIERKNVATRRLEKIEWWKPMGAPPKGAHWHSEETILSMTGGAK